ncbi:MAG: histidinol dehydrogenase [Gammaproteobacteria bacterium]|nr:MAG: histidinol dehydrogenase [Gammaproteobacteria bacterium]
MKIRVLDSAQDGFGAELNKILAASAEPAPEVRNRVAEILATVRAEGDRALLDYTNRFDRRRAQIEDLVIGPDAARAAFAGLPEALRQALQTAADRIRSFHERQKSASWFYEDPEGILLGQQVTPLDRVGVYVPGGKADYPSSVLMNVIPAQVAGVGEIVMVMPAPDDRPSTVALAAAGMLGIEKIFSIGGAQAVGALAYGTELVPAVDKIVGPGGAYVAEAKRQVFGIVGIDMVAGPSEVVIVSDGSGEPDWTAMDLFAQAEHDEAARAILICTDKDFMDRVMASIVRLLPDMERASIIRASLERHGLMIRTGTLQEAAAIVNRLAPEHLELAVREPRDLLKEIRHAGAIFLGHYAAESLGDYCAGPNHVLPTARCARFSSPLGVYDFQKRSSVMHCDGEAAAKLAPIASTLARGEGLTAHARAAEYRLLRITPSPRSR